MSSKKNNPKRSAAASGDVFSVLMSSASKQPRRSSSCSKPRPQEQQRRSLTSLESRFVLCPGGCGKHILQMNIHRHLDECLLKNKKQETTEEKESYVQNSAPESIKFATGRNQTERKLESEEFVNSQKEEPRDHEKEDDDISVVFQANDLKSAAPTCCDRNWEEETEAEHPMPETGTSVSQCEIESVENDKRLQEKSAINNNTISDSTDNFSYDKENKNDPKQPDLLKLNEQSPNNVTPSAPKCHNSAANINKPTKNAFDHMMTESRRVFSQQQERQSAMDSTAANHPSLCFCFWGISEETKNSNKPMLSLESFRPVSVSWKWHGTVRVVDRSQNTPESFYISLCTTASPIPTSLVEPEVSGNKDVFPEQPQLSNHRRRWVQRHSRFSVPVLKSMLQKSVRRRRPLPSVRIAMELADKSLGDLLRRLPIIVLEDSTMHPHFPLLVWLMMAYSCTNGSTPDNEATASSSYGVPDNVMEFVFGIIFEVASCRLRDPLCPTTSNQANKSISLGSLMHMVTEQTNENTKIRQEKSLIPFSILLRSCYGGMKCDITMLQQYAQLWYDRFSSDTDSPSSSRDLPHPLSGTMLANRFSSTEEVTWRQVPSLLLQECSKAKRSGHLDFLLQHRLSCLTMNDICLEGVDFHCSNIITRLLSDRFLVGVASDILLLSNEMDCSETTPFSQLDQQHRKDRLEGIWKSFMWHEMSSVNRRLHLLRHDDEKKKEQEKKQEEDGEDPVVSSATKMSANVRIWNELVAPKVKEYQRDYVRQRLATHQSS